MRHIGKWEGMTNFTSVSQTAPKLFRYIRVGLIRDPDGRRLQGARVQTSLKNNQDWITISGAINELQAGKQSRHICVTGHDMQGYISPNGQIWL